MNHLRKHIAKLISPWFATAVIKGLLPERIGRYRLLDILLEWIEAE